MSDKSVQKKKHILDTARKVFQEKGYKQVTMKDIVDYEKRLMANKTYRYLILGNEKALDMDALGNIFIFQAQQRFLKRSCIRRKKNPLGREFPRMQRLQMYWHCS